MKKLSVLTKVSFLVTSFFALTFSAIAQEASLSDKDILQQLQQDVRAIKGLKLSGYVQAQYQTADTAGIASMAGGKFDAASDSRFKIRRGRLKLNHTTKLSSAVLQFDMTEKSMLINEAYIKVNEPFLNILGITAGIFDRPFGNEIAYSSSTIESLERSRIVQTLFPGEKDLGAQLTLQAPKTSALHFIKIEAGLFNGNGPAEETDSYKDFIGHLHLAKSSKDKKFAFGLGASYYNGGFAAATNKLYAVKTVDAVQVFVSDSVGKGSKLDKSFVGLDFQYSMDWFIGKTQIRAEYIQGTQTAISGSSTSLKAAMSGDAYLRQFNGYYVYFIQDIGKTPFQVVAKYDVYDPNTAVSGNQIGLTSSSGVTTGSADVLYSTVGVGLHYHMDKNTRISAYYDMVRNETTTQLADNSTLKDLSKDRNDNVFTLRLQYKF